MSIIRRLTAMLQQEDAKVELVSPEIEDLKGLSLRLAATEMEVSVLIIWVALKPH
jgi:hypothetical protein